MVSIKERLKLKISKPGFEFEINSGNPDKNLKHINSIVCELGDVLGTGELIKRKPEEEIEDNELFFELLSPLGGCSKELKNKREARAFTDKISKISPMNRTFNLIVPVKVKIDVEKKEKQAQLDIEAFRKEFDRAFMGFKALTVNGFIINIIGTRLPKEDYTLIEEKIGRKLFYAHSKAFKTEQDLGDRITIEIVVYGDFQKTYRDYFWDD